MLILGTSFSFQAITYIQHWGLTERAAPELAKVGYSWEDRCWVQACTTLNVAYHGLHHRRPGLPYYRLSGLEQAPQLPASYPVMFLAALVPPLFDRIMKPRLQNCLAGKGSPGAAARRRSCADITELFNT